MKLDLKSLTSQVSGLLRRVQRYGVIIFVVVIIGVFGFMIIRIGKLAVAEPSDDAVTEKLTEVKRPKIDQNAVAKIQQLQDNSVEVQTLFRQARDNPFEN